MITFTIIKHFGMVDLGTMKLEGNAIVSRRGEALAAVIPTILRTSFCGLSIIHEVV
jgi:hypothetical protein